MRQLKITKSITNRESASLDKYLQEIGREELGCFSGCLMSSAGIQKLFCGIYSTFKCSFDEFVGEKVFSPSYSSAILAPLQICPFII